MTDAPATQGTSARKLWTSAGDWIKAKDPRYLAIKKSARAAIVMPAVFGLTHSLFSNPQVGLFGAFGSFALLLLTDFPGGTRTRLGSYLVLFLVGGAFIAIGTVASTHKVAAVIAMALVGFVVLFAGIVSPQAAVASTAALLVFVLPDAVAQPTSAIGPRLIGWAFAGALCIPATMLLWRTHWHDMLRRRLSEAVSAVSRLADAHADGSRDPEAKATVTSELAKLRAQFASTPYPPTGAAAGAVALAKLVGRVEWVAGNAALVKDDPGSFEPAEVRAVVGAVAETLRLSASLICDSNAYPIDDPTLVDELQQSIRHLDQTLKTALDTEVSALIDSVSDGGAAMASADNAAAMASADNAAAMASADNAAAMASADNGTGMASSLIPSFHARALAVATDLVADAALEASGAEAVADVRMGMQDQRASRAAWGKLVSHLSFRSVWFRNAVRGGAGLALAVGIIEVTNLEHGFWVVLGTLSVLRSNALGTGSTALRAVGGTAVGFLVGSAIMIGVGAHSVLLWVLLPVAVLVSGVAPSMISFAAGQAGFTVVVVILFNIIQPAGWKVGITRFEDVAIGCAVSVVAGLLFWPRGATAALGRALSDAFIANSSYLADSVDRLTTTDHRVDTEPGQRTAQLAYLRLDDTFRQFLAERGAKVVPVETVANLFTGANRLRYAADTLASLPDLPLEPGEPELESVTIAGAVLRDSYALSHRWYEEFAELLGDRRETLDDPPSDDETLHDVLRDAFDDARARRRGDRLRTTLRMLWVDELLETQRNVQVDLSNSAELFVKRRRQRQLI
jgi:uncharacterized membrane protein YccC